MLRIWIEVVELLPIGVPTTLTETEPGPLESGTDDGTDVLVVGGNGAEVGRGIILGCHGADE